MQLLYRFPDYIKPHPLQVAAVNHLAELNNEGFFLDMGTGKTFCFTAVALFMKATRGTQTVVIMPPILLTQWERWLKSISPALSVTTYRGTPKQRQKLDLTADFVLVGLQIFKKDYNRFVDAFTGKALYVGVDEATMIAGIESDAHEKVYDFCIGLPVALLTGTPMNKPTDVYGLLKFTAPGTYRNFQQFCNLHVEERDFFKNPVKFCNLDLLAKNVMVNAQRLLYSDMYSDVAEPLYVPLHYDLDPQHQKLYEQLANDELLKLDDGGKIDATSETKLMHALGQIIVNWGHFAGDPALQSDTIALLEQKISELGAKKVVIFANYKMSVARLHAHFGKRSAGFINSEASPKQKDLARDLFISDPSKQVVIVQYKSGGMGLDGWQHVCHHAAFVEPCGIARDFHQAVARLKRTGQKNRVMVMMMVANRTLQVRRFKALIENDTLVNTVIRNVADLRAMLLGK